MKKQLLFVAALLTAAIASHAQIINADFSIWTTNSLDPSVMDPNTGLGTTGWWEFNLLNSSSFGSSPASVFQDASVVYPGSTYSARIESVVLTTASYGIIKSYGIRDTMGLLFTGTVTGTGSGYKPGEPFTQRIGELDFEYQYVPNGKDTAYALLILTHYSGGKSNQLGVGLTKIPPAASWTLGKIPVVYDSATGNPDTVLVEFSATSPFTGGGPLPIAGSKLWVDNVSSIVAGIDNITAYSTNVSVYPNPASTEVNFRVYGQNAYTVDVFDITGQKVNSYRIDNNVLSVNTQVYSTGLYLYRVYDKTGNLLNIGKFSVAGK